MDHPDFETVVVSDVFDTLKKFTKVPVLCDLKDLSLCFACLAIHLSRYKDLLCQKIVDDLEQAYSSAVLDCSIITYVHCWHHHAEELTAKMEMFIKNVNAHKKDSRDL